MALALAGCGLFKDKDDLQKDWTAEQFYKAAKEELDMAEVDKAHALYLEHGLGARDDAAAMQYLIPGWTFDLKRPALDR